MSAAVSEHKVLPQTILCQSTGREGEGGVLLFLTIRQSEAAELSQGSTKPSNRVTRAELSLVLILSSCGQGKSCAFPGVTCSKQEYVVCLMQGAKGTQDFLGPLVVLFLNLSVFH